MHLVLLRKYLLHLWWIALMLQIVDVLKLILILRMLPILIKQIILFLKITICTPSSIVKSRWKRSKSWTLLVILITYPSIRLTIMLLWIKLIVSFLNLIHHWSMSSWWIWGILIWIRKMIKCIFVLKIVLLLLLDKLFLVWVIVSHIIILIFTNIIAFLIIPKLVETLILILLSQFFNFLYLSFFLFLICFKIF